MAPWSARDVKRIACRLTLHSRLGRALFILQSRRAVLPEPEPPARRFGSRYRPHETPGSAGKFQFFCLHR